MNKSINLQEKRKGPHYKVQINSKVINDKRDAVTASRLSLRRLPKTIVRSYR